LQLERLDAESRYKGGVSWGGTCEWGCAVAMAHESNSKKRDGDGSLVDPTPPPFNY